MEAKNFNALQRRYWDAIIIGTGVSGPRLALRLQEAGLKVLILEAGEHFNRHTYPRKEIDANSKLYWGGGIELNTRADLGILRPKVVGGGSIVNQALLDRFDEEALRSWKEQSGIDFLSVEGMAPWYEKSESQICSQKIPLEYQNGNAKIFRKGLENAGFGFDFLTRAQKDCRFQEGNDCIECLAGCRIDSKQSSAITVLPKAQALGAELLAQFEVDRIKDDSSGIEVFGKIHGQQMIFKARYLVLAAGAIGNSKILLNSGFKKNYPALGENFFTHPQSMSLGLYQEAINPHKGPLQTYKSKEPYFRKNGFKLENVFAPPVAISMLIPGFGKDHRHKMQQITHMACVEVAIRDTNPGRIEMLKPGKFRVIKNLNSEDQLRLEKGKKVIRDIFNSTGATEIIEGSFNIGLHLMGGLGLGVDAQKSVVSPEFNLHNHPHIFVADSSVFPNAPGINPSLTIMALSEKASARMLHFLNHKKEQTSKANVKLETPNQENSPWAGI